MIDLTPLDVRNKRGDFKRILRGYDPQEVDVFLELVADRLEDLVREVMHLRERAGALQQQVSSQSGREQAVQEALVSAQELRKEIRGQAEREAELVLKEVEVEARRQRAEAEAEIRSMLRDAERKLEQAQGGLEEMERRRTRFLKAYRQLLEREMDVVQVEEERKPLEERPIELDLLGGRTFATTAGAVGEATAPAAPPPAGSPEEAVRDAPHRDARPPMDMAVDELAALYEGLEEPLDALAARYGIARGRGAPDDGEATETASGEGPGAPGDGAPAQDPDPEGRPAPDEPDFLNPPSQEGPEGPRWG